MQQGTRAPDSRMSAAQWAVLALLVSSVYINYLDRGNLSVAARQIGEELHIREGQLGLLASAFFWTYALMQFVAGWLVDRLNVKWTYGIAFFVWSAATAATGLVSDFAVLFAFRLLLGVGESVAYPAYSKIVAANYSERHRGLANALIDAGSKCGPGMANLFGALFVFYFGWRWLFLALGFGSLIWLLPWVIWGPHDHYRSAEETRDVPSMLEIAGKREAWGTFLGLFCGNYAWYFLLTWLPYYLDKHRHFSKGSLAVLGSLPFFAIAVSATVFGYVSDAMISRGYSPSRVRRRFAAAGMLLATLMLPAAMLGNANLAVALLVLARACFGMYTANVWAITQTLAGPAAAGKWTGMQNGIGNLSGVVCPYLSGVLVERTGSFVPAFAGVALALAGGALCFTTVIRHVSPIAWTRQGVARGARAV